MKRYYYKGYRLTQRGNRGLWEIEFRLVYMRRWVFSDFAESLVAAKKAIDEHLKRGL